MSHSAPQPHPLESDSESSLSPKIMSEEEITREVCWKYIQNLSPKRIFYPFQTSI